MICTECGKETREVTGPFTEDYRGESFTVEDVWRFECENCDNIEWPAPTLDHVWDAETAEYARRHEMLRPADIKALRKKLGMTQKAFERMLGVSSPTCSRWENNSLQQSRSVDLLMHVAREVPGAADYLRNFAERDAARNAERLKAEGAQGGQESVKAAEEPEAAEVIKLSSGSPAKVN